MSFPEGYLLSQLRSPKGIVCGSRRIVSLCGLWFH